MATASRSLTLSIVGDIDGLQKSLKKADTEIQGFGGKVGEFGKKVAAAFAVAAAAAVAYAGKLAIDGVKAAIEDEAAQLRLANALRSATGATDAQIKATEDYITKTSLAVGLADDELRPAFQRLSVATGSVTKSQELLNLAVDISKGTGKDLNQVVEALSKAYNGQDTQLVRLGIGITAAQAKQLDFRGETQKLSDLYGGAASRNAETFQGRIDRLRVGFNEAKEAVGAALLPVIERLIGFILEYGTPIVDKFKSAWDIIQAAINRNRDEFAEFARILKDVVFPILDKIFGFLLTVGVKAASAIIDAFGAIVGAITPVLNFIIGAINKVIDGINLVKGGADIGKINPIGATNSGGANAVGVSGTTSGAGGAGSASSITGTSITRGGGGAGGFGGAAGATSLKDLADKLLNVQDKFSDLTFQVATGGIGKTAAQREFDKLQAEFRVLEKQGKTLAANPSIINNITVNAIDGPGAARAVANQLNQEAARSAPPLNYQTIREKAG